MQKTASSTGNHLLDALDESEHDFVSRKTTRLSLDVKYVCYEINNPLKTFTSQ